jgi:hypothetical protein
MKMKKLILIIMILILLLSGCNKEKTADEIDTKLDEQNESIVDAVKEVGVPSNGEKFDEALSSFNNSTKQSGDTNIDSIKEKIVNGFFNIAIALRKYTVPFYMFILISNVVLLSTLGSKSLNKRKAYIVGSVMLTIMFVILMNVPIFIIYFQNNTFSEVVTIDTVYRSLYRLVFFLRKHSLTLCLILFTYGLINTQLGKNDIPRKITGGYFKKIALWSFLILQILPFAINFII